VNDASRDRSWPAIRELSARNPRIRGIDLMRNYGQHNALLCGIRKARYSVLVTLDDDLQNPPRRFLNFCSGFRRCRRCVRMSGA